MGQLLQAAAELTNDKVQFTGAIRDNSPIQFDYWPPLGDGRGNTPMEMILMSLAVCSGTAIVALLRKMRHTVSGFRATARGARREQHPTIFESIALEFEIISPDIDDTAVEKAIRMSEETICPVWAMLKGNVEITTVYRIARTTGIESAGKDSGSDNLASPENRPS